MRRLRAGKDMPGRIKSVSFCHVRVLPIVKPQAMTGRSSCFFMTPSRRNKKKRRRKQTSGVSERVIPCIDSDAGNDGYIFLLRYTN